MLKLIKKYSNRLKTLKVNLSYEMDKLTDSEIQNYQDSIALHAEFIKDLKQVSKEIQQNANRINNNVYYAGIKDEKKFRKEIEATFENVEDK